MNSGYAANIPKYYAYMAVTSLRLFVPILVLFFLDNGLSMTEVMTLQSFHTLLIVLFEVPSGMFADLYGRRLSLLVSSLLGVLAFIVYGAGEAYAIFFIAAFVWAVSKSLSSGADQAFLFDSLKSLRREEQFPRYNGRANSLHMLTLGASSAIGAVLGSYTGNRFLFFASAGLFACSALLAWSLREPEQETAVIERGHLAHLKEASLFSLRDPGVRYFVVFFSIFGFFAFMLYYLIQPYFESPDTQLLLGVAVSGYFICCALGSFFAEHFIRRIRASLLVPLIAFLSALAFSLIPLVTKPVAIVLVFVNSFVVGVAGILVSEGINRRTASHHRATVLSVMNFMEKLIYAVIAPLIGYVTDTYTLAAAFSMLGISLFVLFAYYGVLSLLYRKQVDAA